MVLDRQENLVYGIRLSSVGPGRVTGSEVVHDPSGMDLAMKLHYLRGVYFFNSEAARGITVVRIKQAMFTWLSVHFRTCSRFRRSESGRPYLKCNDCGVRFIEAQCDKTIDEWLEMDGSHSHQTLLASYQVIGPELFFSPLVLFQVTHFKCGGVSLGLSWAHVLGDVLAASDFINGLGRIMSALEPNRLPNCTISNPKVQKFENSSPPSIKQVDPVGDHWITPNNCKMETISFPITSSQLNNLQLKILGQNQIYQIPIFELICAIIWQCIAKVREGSEPKLVTICKNDPNMRTRGECSNSSQVISTVKADFSIVDADPRKLAALLVKQAESETSRIEGAMEKDNGVPDFVLYGANLTFVNWEDADFYGLEVQGHKPVCVHYNIQGVGDEGAVLLLPGPKQYFGEGRYEGRVVNIILPEKEVFGLKSELRKNDLLLENELE